MRKSALLLVLVVTAPVATALPNTWLVDRTSPGPIHDGTSWAQAFQTLDAALGNPLLAPGDDLLLAEGTYRPATSGLRTDTFLISLPMQLYGGYIGYNGGSSGVVTPGAPDGDINSTLLSGDIAYTPMNPGDDAYHVVTISVTGLLQQVLLRGMRIQRGYADGPSGMTQDVGGGILALDAWLFLADVTVQKSYASTAGGGVYCAGSSKLYIKRCAVTGNRCTGDGAGIFVGGDTDVKVYNLTASGNLAGNKGGGIRYTSSEGNLGALRIVNSSLHDNSANSGGGISFDANTVGREIINCTIAFNSGNPTGGSGAGIQVDSGTRKTWLWNSIVYYNGPMNDDNVLAGAPALFNVDHTDIGPPTVGLNLMTTFDLDPLFKNSAARNLGLQFGSPCLEVGTDSLLPQDELDVDEDGATTTELLDRDIKVNLPLGPSLRQQLSPPSSPIMGTDDKAPFGVIVDLGAFEEFYPIGHGG